MMTIRGAGEADIPGMVAISEAKRIEYQGYSPVFWRKAPDSATSQELYFRSLLKGTDVIALVAESSGQVKGFVIGMIIKAPPVYEPGGLVCIIDDFAVATKNDWDSLGRMLLDAVQQQAKARGAVLVVVVCGHRDQAKRAFLQDAGLSIASEWYVKSL